MVYGSLDRNIRVERLDSGELVCVIKGHTWKGVACLCVTSDSKYVVSGSEDKTIRITRIDTGKCVRVIQQPGWVTSVCVTPNNTYVVSGSYRTVRITRLDNGELFRVMENHTNDIKFGYWLHGVVCVTADNKYVVYGSNNNITITDIDNQKLGRVIEGHVDRVVCVCVTLDNKYVVSGSCDNTVRITRLDNGQLNKKFDLGIQVQSINVSPNGRNIVAGCEDGSIHVFRTPTYMLQRQWCQVFLFNRELKLFQQYPGLIRYIGTKLLMY